MQEVPPKLDYVPKVKKPGSLPSWVWPVVLSIGIALFLVRGGAEFRGVNRVVDRLP